MRKSGCRPSAACIAAALALAACGTLSVAEERDLGTEFEREARREFRMVRDEVVDGYVDAIGYRIVEAAPPQPFEYDFTVVDDPDINAFAGPAGHIYVHTGTILASRNVSELAGVIAHEVGHVAHRHVAENYNKQRAGSVARQVGVIGAGILGGSAAAGAANLLGGIGMMAVLNSFGREAEREADDFAVEMLPRAGYDPSGLPSFFETLIAEGGSSMPAFLSSHPAPADRLEITRAAIARETLPLDLRVDDGGKLEIIQRRIELLTGGDRERRRSR